MSNSPTSHSLTDYPKLLSILENEGLCDNLGNDWVKYAKSEVERFEEELSMKRERSECILPFSSLPYWLSELENLPE